MNIELWAGAECTVNRVGDRYFDQVVRTGHEARAHDMERLAVLGVSRVRFPVLWERVAPRGLDSADFSWSDQRLARLRELGVAPIIGLLHHGSGPRYATIDDPEAFVAHFARYARMVAERYPWVDTFTPINEPLTTARFCGLYGHWYPHRRDTPSFLRLLLNETRATAAAMAAIREVIPHARLMQTEDIGRSFGTPALADQCEYENERRWLSLDLLAGRVGADHSLREHLEVEGIPREWLDALSAQPCPPDLVGINYYPTSDRYLDERLELYPAHTHGGNGRQRYADVEAVRVHGQRIVGHSAVLEEVWQRYGSPVALSEVHLGCTVDEQLRWLVEAWGATERCAARGVDVRALTAWAAFGSIDWDSLLTRQAGHYEPGLYDVRGRNPRATELAEMVRMLADGQRPAHTVLSGPGWWRDRVRVLYPEPCVARSA